MGHNPLGEDSAVPSRYAPEILFGIERQINRTEFGIIGSLPFVGFDLWNCYECSWLDLLGRPVNRCCRITYGCDSPRIVESKSLKLYLFSLNMTHFADVEIVREIIKNDLTTVTGADDLKVDFFEEGECAQDSGFSKQAVCIDSVVLSRTPVLLPEVKLRVDTGEPVEEILYSALFRSLCPVTAQPDWGCVTIKYQGQAINRSSLLEYLIAYRQHQGFHEECCERIFFDISRSCRPTTLSVMCRFLRRGGLDINPVRTSPGSEALGYIREFRQ